MNDQNPPIIASGNARQLGDDPLERAAIPNVIVAIEAILRHPRRVMFQLRQPGAGKLIAAMLFISIVCSLIYGSLSEHFPAENNFGLRPSKSQWD
ncbi:MAG: hypothetical protein ACREDS_00185 [Limisphaerales bacterium]